MIRPSTSYVARKSQHEPEFWRGEPSPSSEHATQAKICRCEKPTPISDDEMGRYCFACGGQLGGER